MSYHFLVKSAHSDGQNIYLHSFDHLHIDRLTWNTRIECGDLYNKSTLKLIKKWFNHCHKDIETIEVSEGTIVDNYVFHNGKWIATNNSNNGD